MAFPCKCPEQLRRNTVFASHRTLLNAKSLGRIAGCLSALLLQGCLSFTTPQYVLEHQQRIQEQLQVKVDISDASNFTGDVDKVLTEIESGLSPLPENYRRKIGTIRVVDGFFSAYTLMAPFVGGYTTNDGTVFVRNANPTRFLQKVLLFPRNDAFIHEVMHSVHFQEMNHWQATGRPSPEFRQFIKAWECQYFGDVNGDGDLDDRDMEYVSSNAEKFDANNDNIVDSVDVEAHYGRPYVQGRWVTLRGMQVLMWMSFQWLAPRPEGFATPYAKTYVWEDAAETKRFLWRLGVVPALYSSEAHDAAAKKAWNKYLRLKKKDPLLARKVFLVVRYIASHEEPTRLSTAWTRYLKEHKSESRTASAITRD
jgi:hypothetical protein